MSSLHDVYRYTMSSLTHVVAVTSVTAGAALAAVTFATASNALVLSGMTDGPRSLGEAIGAASVGAAAGIALAIPLAQIAGRNGESPAAGIVIGFAVGQGVVTALIAAHNQRIRRTP